jgi:GNAT superfamily N-acetyltransferase
MSGAAGLIREIDLAKEIASLRSVLNLSFATIAEEFGLIPENSRSNAAFSTEADILDSQRRDGLRFYGLYVEGRLVGCYALAFKGGDESPRDASSGKISYLERLCVLPEQRHAGLGRNLVADAARRARELGASRMRIGLIDDNFRLKEWYLSLGFVSEGAERFPHLPFLVRYMELML